VICPVCGRTDVTFLKTQRKWQCKSAHAKRQFSAKVGTIFEDSPLGLEKWLPAVWIIISAKNGVSSCEISRSLGITQKSAWFMLHRIRLAMQNGSMLKIGGPESGGVEADETFIGGKARNMDLSVRQRSITGTGAKDKVAVMGVLKRGGQFAPPWFRIARKRLFRPRSASTSKPVLRFIPMRSSRTTGWQMIMFTR
jgi:transposase-like protein